MNKQKKKGRLDLHDPRNTQQACHSGLYSFAQEIEYARPKENKGEDLFIYGFNTGEGNTIEIYFKRRPLSSIGSYRFDSLKDQMHLKFCLVDEKGNVYSMNEHSVVDFNPHEYNGCGFAFEPIQANRTARLKFRGYLRRNSEPQLHYVQIRFLCLFFSNPFDHRILCDDKLLAKEAAISRPSAFLELLEDKVEQLCQIKGTFKVDQSEERELFFLATIGRRFGPNGDYQHPRKIVKLFGFARNGFAFQIGIVRTSAHSFRYGFMSQRDGIFKLLKYFTLSMESFEAKLHSDVLYFEAHFSGELTKYEFIVCQMKASDQGDDIRRRMVVNGVEGMCFVVEQIITDSDNVPNSEPKNLLDILKNAWQEELQRKLVISLGEDYAQFASLTGSKGASLARLKASAKGSKWSVTNALVVTTSAYRTHIAWMSGFAHKLEELRHSAVNREGLKELCHELVNWFAAHELQPEICEAILIKMSHEFGKQWRDKYFAVRSSRLEEMNWSDSCHMTGQMFKNYLGVKGHANLFMAIVKCWASQFCLAATDHKHEYGQFLNSPMAVVIQEMVECDSAGVIFTANPTDGDERTLTINSNFGLGESISSALTDPDTFKLEVSIKANSYQVERTVEFIVDAALGKKAVVTRINTDVGQNGESIGVIHEHIIDVGTFQSVSDFDVIRLGSTALEIQQLFGSACDIEWGIKGGRIFIFQCRPIMNIDSTFTDYELIHEMDTPHCSEQEIYSRVHWCEVAPGATSWAANFLVNIGSIDKVPTKGNCRQDFNPYMSPFGIVCNQRMFNLKSDSFVTLMHGYPKSALSVAAVFAVFGHHITDSDVLALFSNANSRPKGSNRIWRNLKAARHILKSTNKINHLRQRYMEEKCGEFVSTMKFMPLVDKLDFVYQNAVSHNSSFRLHALVSFGSVFYAMLLTQMFATYAHQWNVDRDVNLLLSHCNGVVSVEVSRLFAQIAQSIKDKEAFEKLSDEQALRVLQGKKSMEIDATILFEELLLKHGHRGNWELDVMRRPWRKDPIPCVQMIKTLVKADIKLEPKPNPSIDELMAQIKTPLSIFKRTLIRKWLLPRCRALVAQREQTQSMVIKFQDNIHEAMWQIATNMTREGILPDPELAFYLKFDELKLLTGGERNAMLVWKAKRRRRLYPHMNALKFDRFIKGFRMAPTSEIAACLSSPVSLNGTAVSVGEAKARVCVAETIDKAANIQQGDILITFATDIGWSPYFLLIKGLVTEIGGTISHSSIVARELGIPCLIAVENACAHFETGDLVHLDTMNGTITKLKARID